MGPIPMHSRLYLAISFILSATLPLLYAIDFHVYASENRTGYDPVVPWQLTCSVDYAWFFLIPFTPIFLAKAPSIKIRRELAEDLAGAINPRDCRALSTDTRSAEMVRPKA